MKIEEIRQRAKRKLSADDYRKMSVSEIAQIRMDVKRLLKELDALITRQEQPNKPLTYEQLQQMEGEPVWCKKEMAYVFVSTLIDKPYKEIYYFTNRGMCKTALLHHTEFYRRKPEQEG